MLLAEFPDPSAVVAAPARWKHLTRSLGLAWRAETFVRACKALAERHQGAVPANETELLRLPGVGHYVARAVLCFGFGRRGVLVDTNTVRLAARISGTKANPAHHRNREVQCLVARLWPTAKPPSAPENFALLDLAGLVCVPQRPKCETCPIVRACVTGRSTLSAGARPTRPA